MAWRSAHLSTVDEALVGVPAEVSISRTVSGFSSFETVYRAEWPGLVRLAFLMTGSRPTAEDIVQDAFVGLHRAWAKVDNPPAYLNRSVVNGVRMGARHRRVTDRYPVEPPRAVDDPEVDETWRLLACLPARQRHALVLRYYQDLPIPEVARLLGCSVGTAKSLIHRGLERLEELVR